MLITTKELKSMSDFKDVDEKILERKMKAIEIAIREHTHNNFQNKQIRFITFSLNNKLNGSSPYLKVGDTIEITESINQGLYTIKEINDGSITFNEDIYDSEHNLITKIEYPADIIEGAIGLLKWNLENADKVGIASETLSRHSVSYKTLDGNNTIKGYPAELFGFCNTYMKARF